MSGEGMDICEDLWSHELSMRRLLSLLRQSQSTCSDTECYQTTPSNNTDDGFMLMTLVWVVIAFFLYMYRPSTGRSREGNLKPSNGGNGEGNPPASPNVS